MKMIEVENLSFNYGGEPILRGISFSVWQGDFVGVIGQNGTGKSTLLRLLLGQITPTSGNISLLGKDIHRYRHQAQIGYVSQATLAANASFPATAEEVVRANLFAQIGLMRFPKQRHRAQARQALESVGMQAYADRLIGNLSGGQLQRVMIARGLVNQPKLMLLDEPTSGIDAGSADSLHELLLRLNRQTGLTIVMVTHDLGRIFQSAHRILSLEEGLLQELDHEQMANRLPFWNTRSVRVI